MLDLYADRHDVELRPVTDAAVEFARCMVRFWQDRLGTDLIGAYLIGSLAHGGFSGRYSDVDMAVIAEQGLPQPLLDDTKTAAVALSPEWGPKLSVFWSDRAFSVGRFPPLDRLDYLDHAVALTECEHVKPPRPSLHEVRGYLGGAPFSGWAEQARQFAAKAALEPKDRKPYLRTLLYPARLCYSWSTGRMGSNDEAVAFVRDAPPSGLDVDLIARALQCRQADADPDALFVERTKLLSTVEACTALIARA